MYELSLWQIVLIELLLVATAAGAAHLFGSKAWANYVETQFARFASRPILSICSLAFASLMLRLVLLPIESVPAPLFHDEFSYLLGADTFTHGRLTNPTPAVAIAFETIHENVSPTYQSMYLPGTALVLAAGKLIGLPWLAVAFVTAALCGAIYWMVAGWLPRPYALLAGIVTIAITGNMSWWFDNYFCIAFTSLGTSLVLGSLPRIAETHRVYWAFLAGIGFSFLLITRPYEGACVTVPCALGFLWIMRRSTLVRLSTLLAAVCAAPALALGWLLYYNWRSTGRTLLFPYMVNLLRYHITGPFIFSARHSLPTYDLDVLRRFYIFAEVPQFDFIHEHPLLFLARKMVVYHVATSFGFGLPLIVGVFYLVRRHREHFHTALLLGACGLITNVALMGWSPYPQYIAPAFPLLVLLIAFGFFWLRQITMFRFAGTEIVRGLAIAELMFVLSIFGYRVVDSRNPPEPQYVSKDRAAVTSEMLRHPGKQLCFVKYSPSHASWQEWVFNDADLEEEKILWARSLDTDTDQKVVAAFPYRTVWLIQPDLASHMISPYALPQTRQSLK